MIVKGKGVRKKKTLAGNESHKHDAIKFCVCLKKNTVETILLLREAYGNEVLGNKIF